MPGRSVLALTAAIVWLLPASLRADVRTEIAGVRSAGMGQTHHGVGTSNDTIMINPAGMSLTQRYSIELQYGYSPLDRLTHMGASAVDSKSGPVAAGLAYMRSAGDQDGVDASLQRFYGALSYPITPQLAVGMTGRHIRGHFKNEGGQREDLSLYSADLGISAMTEGGVSLGFVYHNVIESNRRDFTPPSLGLGIAFNTPVLVLGADAIADMSDSDDTEWSYRAGAEYIAAGQYAMRAGYQRVGFTALDGTPKKENILTAGAGLVLQTGAVDVSFQRSLRRAKNWHLIGALRFFL